MTTLFSSQLARIAADSSHEFDLRARKASHGESLLFSRDVASKQDWDTIYTICLEGFRELRQLDPAFDQYERNLFSPQSKDQDREQMNQAENEALDSVVRRCLGLLGGRVLLNPGLRCVEWLVRRFRVHVHNTRDLLLMVLPYHEMPVWRNILSIIPQQKLAGDWKFVLPYHKDAANVPKHTIVYAATNNDGFFAILNQYVPEICREGAAHTALMRFWTGVVTEAVLGRLGAAKSGRKEVQSQRMEDALIKILPILNDGFEIKGCPELTTACFTLSMILAAKADLDDRVLDSLLQAVALAAQSAEVDIYSAIVTMTVIVAQKTDFTMPRNGVDLLSSVSKLEATLTAIRTSYPVAILVESLINGTLMTLRKKHVSTRISFIERLIKYAAQIGDKNLFVTGVRAVLSRVQIIQTSEPAQNHTATNLIDMLRGLNEDTSLSLLLAEATSKSNEERDQLEALMGTTVALIEGPPAVNHDEMDIDASPTLQSLTDESISSMPSQASDTVSFLAKFDSHLYEQLAGCFALCCKSETVPARFAALPIWSSSTSQPLLYHSFLIRQGLGPYSARQRSAALSLLSQSVIRIFLDYQAIVPYILVALGDSSSSVRRAAGDLLTVVSEASTQAAKSSKLEQFGAGQLYESEAMDQLSWISVNHLLDIISQVFIPTLEECVLDATQIGNAIETALNGPSQVQEGMKVERVELKKSLRHSLFDLLTTHAVAAPLLKVKVNIVQLLENVYKVGSTTKSKALAPVIRSWAALGEGEADAAAKAEKLDSAHVDSIMMQLITAQDRDAISPVLAMIEEGKIVARSELVSAFFNRVQHIWANLKAETQIASALKLFDFSFASDEAVQSGAQSTLQSAELSTDILGGILQQSITGLAQMQTDEQQPRKRRRTSHGHDSVPSWMAKAMEAASSRLTLALELVDNSKPETRPELASVLFELLAILKRLKQQQQLDSPYLLNLCLSSILAIIDRQKSLHKASIDMSSIRADLVTDCIRSSENPQVQNTALLLSASLAKLAPDRMLHNVMPVFTFVGQGVLSKEDDFSINVTNQAIDQIVPAIIQSLRRQKQDMIKSTSGMLASFAAAFDHIPPQRKVALYQRLLSRMGADEYAFVLLSMLALRQGDKQIVRAFIDALLGEFSAHAQLATYHKLLDLASDTMKKESAYAEDVLEINKTASIEDKRRISGVIFGVGLQILKSKSLKSQVSRMHKLTPEAAEVLRNELASCFPQLLLCIKTISLDGQDTVRAKECVDALLDLPSLAELFNMMPRVSSMLEHEPDLHAQALRVLISKVDERAPKDNRTRTAATELLGTLTNYINRPIHELQVKQAIIVCIDKICEAYGRKDLEKVLEAASVVSGEWCLSADESISSHRIKMMSLLCLASLLEVLKESCAPIVPDMLEVVLNILEAIVSRRDDEEMHNASYTLIAGVVAHVPYLISDDNLARLLVISSQSADTYTSTTAVESRAEVLTTLGNKIDLASLVSSMSGLDLEISRQYPKTAELEKLDMISTAIETATKAVVVRNVDAISQYLLTHLDQRRILTSTIEEEDSAVITNVEDKVNQVSIQFIYKLNDTTFRPVFESWMEWGINAHDISSSPEYNDPGTKTLRQTSLFNLLSHFFNTLQSIVTSYASYIITPASSMLKDLQTQSQTKGFALSVHQQSLYTSLLNLLTSTFTYDADNFYASPAHFTPLAAPVISLLTLSQFKPLRPFTTNQVIPTILSLATATVDTPSHHQTLSHNLTLLRHNPSPAVRLASIRTLAALTASEEIGDDWIANTIGVGSAATDGDGIGIARGGGSSAGEVMIYVNEMLEDDDEDVEMEVRRWVQSVREKVGEDVFEV